MCRSGCRQRLALKVQLSHAFPRCVVKRCCEKCCCVPVSSRSYPCRLCDGLSLTPSTHHQMLRKEGLSSLGWSSPGSHIFRPCTLHACMFSTCPEPLLSRRVFVFVLVPAARSRRTGLGAQKLQRFPTGPATVAGPVSDGVLGRRAPVCSVCKP